MERTQSDEEKRMLSIRKCLIDNHIPEEDIFYLLVVNEGLVNSKLFVLMEKKLLISEQL